MKNYLAKKIKLFGKIIIIISVIAALISGNIFVAALAIFIGGISLGFILMGLGEVIQLLEDIKNK